MQTEFSDYNIPKKRDKYWLHIMLFVITFITCMIAGTMWANVNFLEVTNWGVGVQYAILILGFLSAHEFGHYFAAKHYRVDATLPYYIPFPLPITLNFGTFGAVIKMRSPVPSRKALFDIGVAGPLAGFAMCVIYLIYGLSTLPGIDFIYRMHPEYVTKFHGIIPGSGLHFGDTLLFHLFTQIFTNPTGFLPPMNEIYHYPFLNVGWFGLFVTSLNMLPMGQLDGGHITYAMFGRKVHYYIAKIIFWILFVIGGLSLISEFITYFQQDINNGLIIFLQNHILPSLTLIRDSAPILFMGWGGWLFWALIGKFFIKFTHPPVEDESDIGNIRKAIGWIALVIFILSFSYQAIYFVE